MTDLIDNRTHLLADEIKSRLSHSRAAHFAVGYFFLSGFAAIREQLTQLEEVRLLIGATTDRKTVEQLAEGYRQLNIVERVAENASFASRDGLRQMVAETSSNVRGSLERAEQSDVQADLIATVRDMIAAGRLHVRVYTKERLHAKAYIFDHKDGSMTKGSAIIGSSNLSLSGIKSNTELNATIEGNTNHAQLTGWFNDLWAEAQPFDAQLMQVLEESWALQEVSPYVLYIKVLYEIVKDRLREPERPPFSFPIPLLEFQRVAVAQGLQILKDYNGVFISDVVGLGKTYIGLAMLYYLARYERQSALVICPAPLVGMWEELVAKYELEDRVKVMSMGKLREGKLNLEKDHHYSNREVVLIDESHNFRHSNTDRYTIMQPYINRRKAILLTATPRANQVYDIYHQIKLFHPEDRTDLPVEPPSLSAYFKAVEEGDRSLPDLLRHLLIRRTRKHIMRYYQHATLNGEPLQFPERKLEAVNYNIEAVYAARYEQLHEAISKRLRYAKYRLFTYVLPEYRQQSPYRELAQSSGNLRGLMRTLLFKRLESSVYAFRESVGRLIELHENFLTALDLDLIPAGQDAQKLLYEGMDDPDLFDKLIEYSQKYNPAAFDLPRLKQDTTADLQILRWMYAQVDDIRADDDAKLLRLKSLLAEVLAKEQPRPSKVLVFTQYADTANYLQDNLSDIPQLAKIDASTKNRLSLIGRFAPEANHYEMKPGEQPIRVLLATDVLSEGLNLQDADHLINYDLHWNPVRLIQRVGRVDRIGSPHDTIYAYNFLPERTVEQSLGLEERLRRRIREIHDTIGEDNPVLDPTEQVNEAAMYAIYTGDTSILDDEPEAEAVDLTEVEEMIREIKRTNPEFYKLIGELPDGLRSARRSSTMHGSLVFAELGRTQMFYLNDGEGNTRQLSLQEALQALRCEQGEPQCKLPKSHNTAVSSVQQRLDQTARELDSSQEYSRPKLTLGQNYAVQQLEQQHRASEDAERREQLERLVKYLRQPLPRLVTRELNTVRRQGMKDDDLLNILINLVLEYRLDENYMQQQKASYEPIVPRLIVSEGLL